MMNVTIVIEKMVQSVWLWLKARNALLGFTKQSSFAVFFFPDALYTCSVIVGSVASCVLTIAGDWQACLRCC